MNRNEFREWAEKSRERRFRFLYLDRVKYWEDEAFRIENGSLNYERILNRELTYLANVRERFQSMDENTY